MSEEEAKTETATAPAAEEAAAAPVAAAPADAAAAAAGDAPAHEEESNATFEPVVRLEEVETLSGEEEEEVLYTQRAKLFVYGETLLEQGTGNKTWNERGIGNVRFLKHREMGTTRVLMRQEKTMKIICNHMLIQGLVLVPHTSNDRALVWRANDFSDGEVKETDFCIRFADSDIAVTFKETFEKYQQDMGQLETGADSSQPEAQAAGEEAAEALRGLSTSDNTAAANE